MSHPDFCWERERRAVKDHVCGECGRTIAKGERYAMTSGMWDGTLLVNKACLQCASLRKIASAMDDYYSENYYGGLWEWVYNGDSTYYVKPEAAVTMLRLCIYFRQGWAHRDGSIRPMEEIAFATFLK